MNKIEVITPKTLNEVTNQIMFNIQQQKKERKCVR